MATKVRAAVAAVALAAAVVFGITQIAGSNPSDEPSASADLTGTAGRTPESTETRSPSPSSKVTAEPTVTLTPTPAEPEALLASGDSGDDVRELQARLKQIAWYAPKITGEYDGITEEAVLGFQAKRGYEATGEVDQQTWDKLVEMTREPTDDEMHNRLTPGPTIIGPGSDEGKVRELQARLRQIEWFDQEVTGHYGDVTAAAVSGFQVKRGFPETGEVDQRTWDRLVEMTRQPTEDELYNREPEDTNANGIDARCLTGRALCIDKATNSLRWVVDGNVQYSTDVRFGCVGTPTREGQFDVYWKSEHHVSSLYDSEMPFAMFFDGGQAVHYSEDFATVGYDGCSHGCVNVRDYDGIAALFDQVRVGDKVVVYRS
ncbi:MAG TPA: L,D-transpeptidase family protein [Jiangellaceae bacterium]